MCRYARGQGWVWESFFRMIEPYATRIPYMISYVPPTLCLCSHWAAGSATTVSVQRVCVVCCD